MDLLTDATHQCSRRAKTKSVGHPVNLGEKGLFRRMRFVQHSMRKDGFE